MNEEEAFCRKQLRSLRGLATSIGYSYYSDQIMFTRWPESQAWAIVEGGAYRTAAVMLIDKALASGELNIENYKYHPFTGLPATSKEILQYLYEAQEKILKKKLDPLAVTREVTMPLVKFCLEVTERYMVEQGYRLPKWGRPKWLREMEGKT